MVRQTVFRVITRLRERWAAADPEERIEGSGEVYLDPAYNGQYKGERKLQRLANAETQEEDGS